MNDPNMPSIPLDTQDCLQALSMGAIKTYLKYYQPHKLHQKFQLTQENSIALIMNSAIRKYHKLISRQESVLKIDKTLITQMLLRTTLSKYQKLTLKKAPFKFNL